MSKIAGEIIELNGKKFIELDYHEEQLKKLQKAPKVVTKEIIRKEIVHKQDNKIKKKIDELRIEMDKYRPIQFGMDFTRSMYDEEIRLLESLL